MDSDAVAHVHASAPKDFGKKKRANRSAKLKQCKLDARREQWLSQRAVKKEPMGQGSLPCNNGRKNPLENLEMRQRGRGELGEEEIENGLVHPDYDLDSPSNSPTNSSILGGTDSGTNFTGSSSSSSSSSSGGCCSGNITEEEEDGNGDGEDNCLDDWEAVADALAANDGNSEKKKNQNGISCLESVSSMEHKAVRLNLNPSSFGSMHENLMQECPRTLPPKLALGNSRAWREDDTSRPSNLPTLSKQRSLSSADRHWACVVNAPSCPICCEELDHTDSSFLPCPCGFRLCLFCHKRILEEDGRCPGCRKPYEHVPVEAEASLHGGSLTFKMARSYSMIARS